MNNNVLKKYNLYFPALLAYLFLFWIPISSEGQYYEIVTFNFILNKIVLTIVFLSLLVSATYRLLQKPVCNDVMFLYCLGAAMIIFNSSVLFLTQGMNFVVTGFALMLAPLIYSLEIAQLKNTVVFTIVSIILFAILTVLDFSLSLSLNPLVEMRYYFISEELDSIRLQNNSLFAQKNAFGAIFSLLFLTLLYLDTSNLFEKKRRFFYLLLLSSIVLLLSSFSAGGIIVGMLGFLFWTAKKTKYGFIVAFLLLLYMLQLILSVGFDDQLARKIVSVSTKLERSSAFVSLVSANPSILLLGFNAFNDTPYYTESTLLDMILNFGILIPIIFVVYILIKAFNSKSFFLAYLYISVLFMMSVQNSAFLVPSAIIFLVVGSLQRRI